MPDTHRSARKESTLNKAKKIPDGRGRVQKLLSGLAARSAAASGRLLYKAGVRFLADEEWREPYARELAADTRSAKSPMRNLDRRFMLIQVAEAVRKLPGSTVECGVFRGVGSALICRALEGTYAPGDAHFAFDAFEGLPAPVEKDQLGQDQWWTEGDLKSEAAGVAKLLAPFSHARIEVGWIPERFDQVGDRTFRLIHIDVDLHDPTRDSIDFFFHRLVPGGMMLLDDHGIVSCPGARAAAEEYFAKTGDPIIELPTGQALIIKGASSR